MRQQNETQIANPTPEAEAVARLKSLSLGNRRVSFDTMGCLTGQDQADLRLILSTLPQAGEPSPAQGAETLTAIKRGLRRWLEWDFEGSERQYAEGANHVFNALLDDRVVPFPPILPDQQTHLDRLMAEAERDRAAPAQPDAGELREAVAALQKIAAMSGWTERDGGQSLEDAVEVADTVLAALTGTQQAKGEG